MGYPFKSDSGGYEAFHDAMVDVVFLLRVFFIIAFEPVDIHAILSVDRPSIKPPLPLAAPLRPSPFSRIVIFLNGRIEPFEKLQKKFHKLAKRNISPPIRIIYDPDVQHARLVRVLNLCEETDLTKISLLIR